MAFPILRRLLFAWSRGNNSVRLTLKNFIAIFVDFKHLIVLSRDRNRANVPLARRSVSASPQICGHPELLSDATGFPFMIKTRYRFTVSSNCQCVHVSKHGNLSKE